MPSVKTNRGKWTLLGCIAAALVFSFFPGSPVSAQWAPDPHTLALYHFDEASGAAAADSSGNDRSLSLQGSASFGPGYWGRALRLPGDASSFAVRPADDAVFNFGAADFTVELRVKFDAFNQEQVLIEKFYGGGGPGWTFTLLNPHALRFHAHTTGGGVYFDVDPNLAAGRWYHLATVKKGKHLSIYADGVLLGSKVIPAPITDTDMPLLLGRRNGLSGQQFPLRGSVDEVRISNVARYGAEGLVSYWPADGNAIDAVGSNDGALVNGASFAAGAVGQGFSFDGADDFVQALNPAGIPLGNSPRTIAAWIKSAGPNTGDVYQGIAGYGTPTLEAGTSLFFQRRPDKKLHVMNLVSGTGIEGTGDIEFGEWYFVALTHDGTTSKVYRNGVFDAGDEMAHSTNMAADGFRIGSTPYFSDYHLNFNGVIDEVAVFDRALTPEEIHRIYTSRSYFTIAETALPFWDDFGSAQSPFWQVTNPDPLSVSLTDNPGNLRLYTTATDIHGAANTLKNLYTVKLPENLHSFAATAKMSFPARPGEPYQQAGIVLLSEANGSPDMDNCIRAMYVMENGRRFEVAYDINGAANPDIPNGSLVEIQAGSPFWIRIIKTGDFYQALYSQDGNRFTSFYTVSGPWNMAYAGIFALHGSGSPAAPLAFDFDSFEITPVSIDLWSSGLKTAYAAGDDGDYKAGLVWPYPRFTDNGNQTMTDNLTGLTWAKDTNVPGPAACSPGAWRNWWAALDYAACLNSNNYLGFSDWRIPNRKELFSVVNHGVPSQADWLSSFGFENIYVFRYWTSTSDPNNPDYAYIVYLGDGGILPFPKGGDFVVWPVRGAARLPALLPQTGQTASYHPGDDGALKKGTAWPNPRFADNGDETLTDLLTGLVWTQSGEAPGPAACVPGASKTWQEALDHVDCLNSQAYLGRTDWRLPNVVEMESLVNAGQASSGRWLNESGFADVPEYFGGYYWTSTSLPGNPAYAWMVFMWDGPVWPFDNPKTSAGHVWPVRGGFVPEDTPPAGSVAVNGGAAYTRLQGVTLSLSASDPSGIAEMCVSNTGACSSWEAFAASKPWALTAGDGGKTVSVWFKDLVGNINPAPYSASIILDTVPPGAPANPHPLNPTLRGQIRLAWDPVADPALDGYRVYFGESSGSYPQFVEAGSQTYFTLTGLTPGQTYFIVVRAVDRAGNEGDVSPEISAAANAVTRMDPDYDGDGATDIAAYHLSTNQFFTGALGNLGQYGWGGTESYPLVWDFDGDGRADVSIYHIPTNQWFVKGYPGDNLGQFGWGMDESIPVPGDYDGDGAMERAFYHAPSNRWFIEGLPEPILFGFNGAECLPVAGDFDGDGATDMVLYHWPSNQWFMYGVGDLGQYGWGGADCIPVPADYDGDGRIEIAVYHIPTNQWFVKGYPGDNLGQYGWGGPESFPIPGDYNGDGLTERGFYRFGQNWWFVEGEPDFFWGWGGADFMPVAGQSAVFNWFRLVLGRFQ